MKWVLFQVEFHGLLKLLIIFPLEGEEVDGHVRPTNRKYILCPAKE